MNLKEDIDDLAFDVRKSIRYLTKRKRFFDNWNYFLVTVTALSGSSAFASLISSCDHATLTAKILTGIVAVSSAVDLAIGFSKKSQQYDGLQRRFSDLLSEIIQSEPLEQNLKQWEVKRLEIEKDEPPTLTALEIFCRNEELRAQGLDEKLREFDWVHKLLMHWISFEGWVPPLVSEALKTSPISEDK